MNILYKLLGYSVLGIALLVDPIVVAAMIYVLWSSKSVGALIFVGICLWLWFSSKSNSRPFDAWKPSTIKAFLKSWNEISH